MWQRAVTVGGSGGSVGIKQNGTFAFNITTGYAEYTLDFVPKTIIVYSDLYKNNCSILSVWCADGTFYTRQVVNGSETVLQNDRITVNGTTFRISISTGNTNYNQTLNWIAFS